MTDVAVDVADMADVVADVVIDADMADVAVDVAVTIPAPSFPAPSFPAPSFVWCEEADINGDLTIGDVTIGMFVGVDVVVDVDMADVDMEDVSVTFPNILCRKCGAGEEAAAVSKEAAAASWRWSCFRP